MAGPLRLVIDASIDNRLSTELNARGRDAVAASKLDVHRLKDDELIRVLASLLGDPTLWVLVTGDDSMPADHAGTLAEFGITVATVHPRRPPDAEPDKWPRDVVHRWAHAMQGQAPGSIRRYALNRHAPWTPRRR